MFCCCFINVTRTSCVTQGSNYCDGLYLGDVRWLKLPRTSLYCLPKRQRSDCEWAFPATEVVELVLLLDVRVAQMQFMNWCEAVGQQNASIGRVLLPSCTYSTDWYVHLNCFANLQNLGNLAYYPVHLYIAIRLLLVLPFVPAVSMYFWFNHDFEKLFYVFFCWFMVGLYVPCRYDAPFFSYLASP